MKADRESYGFTLIEIMAVVLIMGLVMGMVMVNVMDRIEWARVETTKIKMKALEGALEMFQIETQRYPETSPGLTALLPEVAGGRGFVRDGEALEDAWTRPFEYESPGRHRSSSYDMWSWGRDGQSGGEGSDTDITNWTKRHRRG